MGTGFENNDLIAKLPQEGVHCFPANESQIKNRRIITVILMVVFIALAVVFCLVLANKQYILGAVCGVGFLLSITTRRSLFFVISSASSTFLSTALMQERVSLIRRRRCSITL